MNFEVGEYRIVSKSKNVQLLQFYEKKSPVEGTPQFGWKHRGYYPTMEQALSGLLDERLKDSEAKSVQELIWEIRKAKEDVMTEFRKAQVRAYENAQPS